MASNAIIPCGSSSSHAMRKYDVFVSFRGEDTRNNFTGFLFQALRRKGIDAFKDDTHLKKGESIAPELVQAIEGSHLFIVVLSKNYPSSTWCLRELAQICNYIETSPRQVLPIFYDVDPSDVRKQSGHYEKAFVELEERFREDKEKMQEVQRWRQSLTRVANLSGWHIANKPQYVEIEKIVQEIITILGHKFLSLPNENLVGLESQVEELAKLLCLGPGNDVRVVGISGMSGIGKTTLARALYERISHQYDFRCFIDDVSKIHRDSNILGVQKQLLSQCLNETNLEICNVSEGTCLAWTRLRNARALIVLDNVDQVGQLQMFTGNRDSLLRECLGGGSKIIIISRDKHILSTYEIDDVYQVQPLNGEDAFKLFCINAFKGNYIMKDYEDMTYSVLSYAQGHPLAIQVLGSSLFGRNVSQWRSALAKLREQNSNDIMDVLRISFDQLDDTNKEIFLDIACFFIEYEVHFVKEILDFRGFHPECGLQDLIDKSLINIDYGNIKMHGLLQDLGKCIIREKSPREPRKWSRLWDFQDLQKVMSDKMAAENVEAVVVELFYGHMYNKFHATTIRADALSQINNLKLLKLKFVDFSGSLCHLSNELGYLFWHSYPFECLPPSFQPDKLVVLVLHESKIKQLWEDTKPLHNLRRLDLSDSKNLFKLPDFGEALNLEWLKLKGCIKLKHIHPSIGLLRKLTLVNLEDCRSLIKLPHFGEALNLEWLTLKGCIKLRKIDPSISLLRKLSFLNLEGCRSLVKLPDFGENLILETLTLKGCVQLSQISSSIGFLKKLTYLNLNDCKNLVNLPHSLLCLNSLEYLNLSGCSKLFQNEVRNEEHLNELCIGEAPVHSRTTSSIMKRWFPSPLRLLYSRAQKDSLSCLLPSLPTFPCMRELDLSFCNLLQIPDAIGNLHFLEGLNLMGNNFATLPSFKELSKLYYLGLNHCKQLKYLPELPSRTDLSSEACGWPQAEPHIIYKCFQNNGLIMLQPPFPYSYYPLKWGTDIREAGLYIFNCPELVERERCTSMTISWMIQIVQAYHQLEQQLQDMTWWPRDISSIIPGSEIPMWFDNQHVGMGNVINIDPSPLMQHHNNSIGTIACCVVFSASTGRGTVLGMRPPETEKKKFPHPVTCRLPLFLNEDLVTDKSDHMWLFYFNPGKSTDLSLKIETVFGQCFDIEVKKFGYRWIYEPDQEHSNLTMIHSSVISEAQPFGN